MINNLVWNDLTIIPERGRALLIYYHKKSASKWGGNTGKFYTQGYVDIYLGNITWNDYTSRLIVISNAKKPTNQILSWAYIDNINLENV